MKNSASLPFKFCFILAVCVFTAACTSVKPMPEDAPGLTEVDSCNLTGHLRCIYLTGKETIDDGLQRQWTRHWFRMSYIGKACEREHGRPTAVVLESLFAIPHYFSMAIGNAAATVVSFFKKDRSPPQE